MRLIFNAAHLDANSVGTFELLSTSGDELEESELLVAFCVPQVFEKNRNALGISVGLELVAVLFQKALKMMLTLMTHANESDLERIVVGQDSIVHDDEIVV